jgi:Na+-driven multidrug efflux pump
VWDEALLIVGVVLFPLPALVLGLRGLFRHRGYVAGNPDDRASVVVMVTMRMLVLLLLLALSGVTLISCTGAWIKDVELHGLVYVFFTLDLLLAALVLLTFGRSGKRPARRRATPAPR